jgi:exopolysaccharide biosynthesis protein
MTYREVALVLEEFGAVDALALDGGGSANLVMADGQERPVANSLSITIERKKVPAATSE